MYFSEFLLIKFYDLKLKLTQNLHFFKFCGIINFGRVKNTYKRRVYIIIKSKLKNHTKEFAIVLGTIIFWFVLITAIIVIRYKPVYEVKIGEEIVGYINNKKDFESRIEEEILLQEGKNIENVSLNETPNYEGKLLRRSTKTNEEEILQKLKNEFTTITYKYYVVALDEENRAYVDTIEEAEEVINKIKEEFNEEELNLQVITKYTENVNELIFDTIEVAENNVKSKVEENIQKAEEEKERANAIASINGVNLSVLPVNGMITSRYGVSSRIRSSTHTGLDIACPTGTPIKVTSKGKVTFAQYNGSYGNLVKVDHGNGVETWYAHCSKIYVKVGQEVKAGDVIAAVGSTGNSTGSHLHLEIRINGQTVNPQNYLY